MPFDAATYKPPLTDQLADLGITPVPDDQLRQHRHKVVRRHGGVWNIVPLTEDRLDRQLRAFGAPRRVRRLAGRVRDAVPGAQFVLGYHYRDPYLVVCRGDDRACLGIWLSRFWTVAIAKH